MCLCERMCGVYVRSVPMASGGRVGWSQHATVKDSGAADGVPTTQYTTPMSIAVSASASIHTHQRTLCSWVSTDVPPMPPTCRDVVGERSDDCPNRGASSTSSWWRACLGWVLV